MDFKQCRDFYNKGGKTKTYIGPDTFVTRYDHKVAHYTYQNYSRKADCRNRNWF